MIGSNNKINGKICGNLIGHNNKINGTVYGNVIGHNNCINGSVTGNVDGHNNEIENEIGGYVNGSNNLAKGANGISYGGNHTNINVLSNLNIGANTSSRIGNVTISNGNVTISNSNVHEDVKDSDEDNDNDNKDDNCDENPTTEDTNVKIYVVVGNNIPPINHSTLNGRKYKNFKQIIKEYGEDWKGNDFLMESTNKYCLYSKDENLKFSTSMISIGGKIAKTTKLNGVVVKFPETVCGIIMKDSEKHI